MFSYRADVERQDKDDEEAEVPGQQRSQQDHPLLLPQISIAVEEVQGQEENDHDHDSQRSATHSDEWTDRRQGLMMKDYWRKREREVNR